MPDKSSQRALSKEQSKIRLLAIDRMLRFDRYLSASQIQRNLELKYNIRANRKTIYDDIRAIDRFCPIEISAGAHGGFRKYSVLEAVEYEN